MVRRVCLVPSLKVMSSSNSLGSIAHEGFHIRAAANRTLFGSETAARRAYSCILFIAPVYHEAVAVGIGEPNSHGGVI